jgi:hypothetical protein
VFDPIDRGICPAELFSMAATSQWGERCGMGFLVVAFHLSTSLQPVQASIIIDCAA